MYFLAFFAPLRETLRSPEEEPPRMTENEIASVVVDAALKIHRALGPGLLESVYEATLAFELERRGLRVLTQQALSRSSRSRRLLLCTARFLRHICDSRVYILDY